MGIEGVREVKQIILLSPNLPQPLEDLLSEHIRRNDPQVFLVADSVTPLGGFLELDILPLQDTEDGNMVWRVQIPAQYVLAIAQFRPSAKHPMGFAP